jgi:UDP-glucose 4-epimerase
VVSQRVFLTGGLGFIGSHLACDLVKSGYRVTIYDNASSGLRENIAEIADDVEVVAGDILDKQTLARAARGHDIISHQAAQLEITKCIDDPIDDLRTNLIGSINVLEVARDIGAERVIMASSACVYGQAVRPPSEEDDGPHYPNWSYGASKLAAEKYAHIFSQDYGFPVFSLRYAIVYGPREWYGRALTIFLKRALEGKAPVVFGDGSQVRDFVYIDQITKLHHACLETKLSGAHAFNGGTGVATSIRELAELICEVTGLGLEPLYEDVMPGQRSSLVDGRMRLPAELQRMQLSPTKTEQMLGVRPNVALRDGLRTEWEWIRMNPTRWTEMHY